MHVVRELTDAEVSSPSFRHLLWLAVEVDDASLDAIVRDELPRLTMRGVADGDRVVGFVAFDAAAVPLTIEYIAVDEGVRGRGYGAALVACTQSFAPDGRVYAQTDDDAVEFYRRVGFSVAVCERDERWPDRQRYDCVLGA